MKYTVYDTATGVIVRSGDCPADMVALQAGAGESLLYGVAADDAQQKVVNGSLATRIPDPPTVEEVARALELVVQRHMDSTAAAMGYDNIFTAVTYAEEPAVPKFQDEGRALRTWRSQVWAFCYSYLLEVQAGQRAVPTPAELIAALPPVPEIG